MEMIKVVDTTWCWLRNMHDDAWIVELDWIIDLELMMLGWQQVVEFVNVDFEFNYLKAEKLITCVTLARLYTVTVSWFIYRDSEWKNVNFSKLLLKLKLKVVSQSSNITITVNSLNNKQNMTGKRESNKNSFSGSKTPNLMEFNEYRISGSNWKVRK